MVKNTVLDPLQFFLSQFLNMHPLNAYFWIPGVIALVRAKSIANTRWLGITSLFFYILTNIMHAMNYYLAGIYLAFSAGAIAWEHRFATRYAVQQNRILASPVYEAALFITAIVILPLSCPTPRSLGRLHEQKAPPHQGNRNIAHRTASTVFRRSLWLAAGNRHRYSHLARSHVKIKMKSVSSATTMEKPAR